MRGRIADGGTKGVALVVAWAASEASAFAPELELELLGRLSVLVEWRFRGDVMSAVNCWSVACRWVLEESVTRGMQRKCVSGGLDGMSGRIDPV